MLQARAAAMDEADRVTALRPRLDIEPNKLGHGLNLKVACSSQKSESEPSEPNRLFQVHLKDFW
jgi:hypothetical protein